MAAHGLSILREFAAGTITDIKIIEEGLFSAPGLNNLEFKDYITLRDSLKEGLSKFQEVAQSMLEKYEAMWKELGKPSNYEAWSDAQFGERNEEN